MRKAVLSAGYEHAVAVVNGISLHYVRGPSGGTPLLLIPAQMATSETYSDGLPGLAQQFEVYAPACAELAPTRAGISPIWRMLGVNAM
ncbi:hypothetical protein [Agromyces sp. NPDC049794]|uniref:alpha/beta fold hydrolase n=1 Tax=unclassified Agromyces TaxID=2639701 RepID=UPI0033D9CA68